MSVLAWIGISVVIYLLIGVAVLIYAVMTDPWGGMILHFWWVVVLFYPYFLIRGLFST